MPPGGFIFDEDAFVPRVPVPKMHRVLHASATTPKKTKVALSSV